MKWKVKPKRFLRNFVKILLYLLIFSFILIAIFFSLHYLRVKKIEVVGDIALNGLQIAENKIIIFLDSSQVTEELLKLNPHVSQILIVKKYPDSLRILVTREPAIAVLPANEGFFLLNVEGKIVKKTKEDNSNYPVISYFQNFNYTSYSVGDILDFEDILSALCFVANSALVGIDIDNVDIRGKDMIILNSKDSTFFTSTDKSCQTQLDNLSIIIKRYTIEGKKIKTLDLRYKKPVVVFK